MQVGSDMLFEQIPAYLEFFGFQTTTPENLRVYAFAFIWAPLKMIGATGSPANPIAIY
jgi:hypothetical protein